MPEIDLGTPVSDAVDWLTENFSGLFGLISDVMLWLLNAVLAILTAPHALVVTAVFVQLLPESVDDESVTQTRMSLASQERS